MDLCQFYTYLFINFMQYTFIKTLNGDVASGTALALHTTLLFCRIFI